MQTYSRWALAAWLVVPGLGCSETSEHENIVHFVRSQSTESYLRNEDGVFLSIEGEHRASDWVAYFLSPYSTRNWLQAGSEEAEHAIGVPVQPAGVSFVRNERNPALTGTQAVVSSDDTRSVILLTIYTSPSDEPVLETEWTFPAFD